jgi:hypothetical protein
LTDKTKILAAIGVTVVNVLLARRLTLIAITAAPIFLIFFSALIGFGTKNVKAVWKSVLVFGLIALNDIGMNLIPIKDSHDNSFAADWIRIFFYIGLLPAFIITATSILVDRKVSGFDKFISIGIFSILVSIHLYFLSSIGLGQY